MGPLVNQKDESDNFDSVGGPETCACAPVCACVRKTWTESIITIARMSMSSPLETFCPKNAENMLVRTLMQPNLGVVKGPEVWSLHSLKIMTFLISYAMESHILA